MNPFASHTFRVVLSLLLLAPLIAWLVALTGDIEFGIALAFTLYVWGGVSAVLLTVALILLLGRVMQWMIRALRSRIGGTDGR